MISYPCFLVSDKFALQSRGAVRAKDFVRAMLDLAPAFVHFSGHGASSGSICVEDEAGNSIELEPEAIAVLFEASGFALGGVFGMIGTVVVATALLAVKFFRSGNDVVAAGFLVFAIGEGVMLSGTATTLAGSVPSFGAGTALWSAALLLTGVPREFAVWARLAGVTASILFAITAARIFWGEQVLPTSSPLPFLTRFCCSTTSSGSAASLTNLSDAEYLCGVRFNSSRTDAKRTPCSYKYTEWKVARAFDRLADFSALFDPSPDQIGSPRRPEKAAC